MSRTLSISFAAVLVVWIGARIIYFNGYYTEDAPGYVSDAIAIARGDYQARNHVNGLNIGTYAPVAVPLRLLGKTDAALSIWPLFCSALGVFSVAGIAWILFGPAFGVLGAFLYATYPGDIFFSTVVMPDAIQSGWLSFSMFLMVVGLLSTSSRRNAMLLAAGVAMGICHLIRANGALLIPIGAVAIFGFALWPDRPDEHRLALPANPRRGIAHAMRDLTLYAIGWIAVLAIEGLVYLSAVGDFLFRFHVVDRHYGMSTSIAQWGLNTHPLTIPYSAFPPLTWWRFGIWGDLNPDQGYHGLIFTWALLLLIAAAATTAVARDGVSNRARAGLLIAAFWFAWPLLYHQFGSQSLTQFIPIHRLSRHLVVYAPGAIVAVVAGCAILWRATRSQKQQVVLSAIAMLLLTLHLFINVKAERVAYHGYHRIKDTYERIRDHLPRDTRLIVADPGDLGFFDFWLNPIDGIRVELQAFANYATCNSLTQGVVFTYSNPGWERLSAPVIQETVARLPCLVQPPANWRLLYGGYEEKIYLLQGGT